MVRRRELQPAVAIDALGEWLKPPRTLKGLQFLADCLKEIGTRKDL